MSRPLTTPEAWHAAKESGAVRYVDPRPCPRGHVGQRWTSNMRCVACARLARGLPIEEMVAPAALTPAAVRALVAAVTADPMAMLLLRAALGLPLS